MQSFSHYHFFLGGHDAEMMEIRNILSKYGCLFEDAELRWDNAKLSVYREKIAKLSPHEMPVLIELEQDLLIPERAKIIDHHGKLAGANKKTSIEQVAELLGIELTHEQQLISANDRGHIRGMLAIGAKPEKIEDVRALDRKAQGITKQDYVFAEEAIANIKEPFPSVALIESKTKRTAAIIDDIWDRYQTFIIKAPDEVHISGPGKLIDALKKHYETLKKEKPDLKFWFGGMLPIYGFFGATHYDEKDLLDMAKKETTPISQHVFLFPFRIEKSTDAHCQCAAPPVNTTTHDIKKDREQERKDEARKVYDVYTILKNSIWKYKSFNPFATSQAYNDYSYFHDYARTALFEKKYSPETKEPATCADDAPFSSDHKPNFVSCLLHRCDEKGQLKLNIKKKKGEVEHKYRYTLKIDGISVRLFETGIAILAIELSNYHYSEFEDIQRINDNGRRVYPQFLGDEDEKNKNAEIDAVKNAFLADGITVYIDNTNPIEEDFKLEYFKDPTQKPPHHFNIGKHITELMGKDFTKTYSMEPIIDDRMFTLCWYNNKSKINQLTTISYLSNDSAIDKYKFESSKDWYSFIFLDGGGCMCPDEKMRSALIDTTTYRRWNQEVSGVALYGISRYSIVCLAENNFSMRHMRRQYRLMAEILLAQRASIVTFFSRVEEISREIDKLDEDANIINDNDVKNIGIDIRKLNSDFLGFKNRLWFTEVTPQEQGIEMYDMAMKNMGLEKQMEELKDEIRALYEYAEMQTNRITNRSIHNLTLIAAIAVPISIVLALFGVSKDIINSIDWWWPWLLFVLAIIISALSVCRATGKYSGKKIINHIVCLFRGKE